LRRTHGTAVVRRHPAEIHRNPARWMTGGTLMVGWAVARPRRSYPDLGGVKKNSTAPCGTRAMMFFSSRGSNGTVSSRRGLAGCFRYVRYGKPSGRGYSTTDYGRLKIRRDDIQIRIIRCMNPNRFRRVEETANVTVSFAHPPIFNRLVTGRAVPRL
jgi:hypothetical protein